jgi:hypothetical protein
MNFFPFLKIQQNLQLGICLSFLKDSLAIAKLIEINLLFFLHSEMILFSLKAKKKNVSFSTFSILFAQ